MAIALTVSSVERGSRRKRTINYRAAFSGTYATNGDTIDFTGATGKPGASNQFPSEAPEMIFVQGAAGFNFEPVIGTTPANSKLKCQASAGSIPIIPFSAADLKGATIATAAAENADQASAPVNPAIVSAAATFTASAGSLTIAANPDVPRNLVVTILNDSGGTLNLFQGVTTFTVTGLFRGVAQTEAITFTSSAGNKALATAKFRFKAGVKPFDSVTSITYDNAADGGLKTEVGPGSRIGTPINSATGTDASYFKAMLTAADYALTGKIDHTNKTVEFGTTADNWDFLVEYAPAAGELPNGVAYPAALVSAQANLMISATFRGV